MKEHIFHIKGRIPSKKNSKSIFRTKAGKPFIMSSQKHRTWSVEVISKLIWQRMSFNERFPVALANIEIDFLFPDNRKTDLTNKAESVMDALVDAGIIRDDCWSCVPKLNLRSLGADKNNAGAIIRVQAWREL